MGDLIVVKPICCVILRFCAAFPDSEWLGDPAIYELAPRLFRSIAAR